MGRVDDYENKLENLNISARLNSGNRDEITTEKNYLNSLENPYYIERNKNNQFERTYLPQVDLLLFELLNHTASKFCQSNR